MDILLPDIHMLMLTVPWSWDWAMEDIHCQTWSSVASGPGWAGAAVVVGGLGAIPATRAAQQLSNTRGDMARQWWWQLSYPDFIPTHRW